MSRSKAVNLPLVLLFLGVLILIEGVFLLIPFITACVYSEKSIFAFGCSMLSCILVGGLIILSLRRASREMGKREAYIMTAMTWFILALFGTLPFLLSPSPMSFSDAFFEAMSGFTTTGVSIMTSIEHLEKSVLIWRSEMNWIGGMGIILLTIAILPMLNHSGGMQMFNAEVTGITHEKLRPRISSTAKQLWGIYVALTVILCLLLLCGPMDFFDSLCHAFSTVSTGGFSTRDASIGAWNSSYIDTVIMIFMFLGGVNFALIYRAIHGNWRSLTSNSVFRAMLLLIAVYYLLFVAAILIRGDNITLSSLTIDPLFMVVSTITSTGLTVKGVETWGPFPMALICFMMFFGASAGSTSGGAKIDRCVILAKNLRNEVYRTVHPNSVLSVRINGKVVSQPLVERVMAFLAFYVLTFVFGGTLLAACGVPLADAMFSSFSCIGNTGLSASLIGSGPGYEALPDIAKWILSFIMLTGRLEIFTIILLFFPNFWRK